MKLNEKILYYRKRVKLSQEELAERIGVSRQAVSKWELGDATPEVDKLLALSRAFGVTTDELLSGDEPAQPRPQAAVKEPDLPPRQDSLDRACGFLGRMIRRFGWLAGVYVALSGLGVTIVGGLARWGFGAMFAAERQMMGEMTGGLGGVTAWSYSGPPELEEELMSAFTGGQQAAAQASPFAGVEGFFLGAANVILIIGIIMLAAGVVLAAVLYKKGRGGKQG